MERKREFGLQLPSGSRKQEEHLNGKWAMVAWLWRSRTMWNLYDGSKTTAQVPYKYGEQKWEKNNENEIKSVSPVTVILL